MSLGQLARNLLNHIGIDVYHYPMITSAGFARNRALNHLKINLILDVGANVGQYGKELRKYHYNGRIISFEPVSAPFSTLKDVACRSPAWECRHLGLGEQDGSVQIHVAGTCSSILERRQNAEGPQFATDTVETIQVARLDTLWPTLHSPGDRTWLKMDVQGYETHVLNGADKALNDITAVEMEMSLSPLYSGQTTYRTMIDFMESKGFELWSLYPGGRNLGTGRLLEMDGTFVRRSETTPA